jgi:hypothetical protein
MSLVTRQQQEGERRLLRHPRPVLRRLLPARARPDVVANGVVSIICRHLEGSFLGAHNDRQQDSMLTNCNVTVFMLSFALDCGLGLR